MLSRFAACWLVALVLAPFTAPFPTCDLVTLFGHGQTEQAPLAPPGAPAVSHDAAVVGASAVFRAGRIRVLSVFQVSPLASEISSSSATVLRSVASTRDAREDAALKAVLRV
jgi:hypothetical protein